MLRTPAACTGHGVRGFGLGVRGFALGVRGFALALALRLTLARYPNSNRRRFVLALAERENSVTTSLLLLWLFSLLYGHDHLSSSERDVNLRLRFNSGDN